MRKVKWGVIGCGGIAKRRTIPGMCLVENAELTAVMDVNLPAAKQVGETFGAAVVCKSTEELIAQDIEAVYIATPVFAHKEQAIAAMRAGKHVLVEKPAGLNPKPVPICWMKYSRNIQTRLPLDLCVVGGNSIILGFLVIFYKPQYRHLRILCQKDI